MPEPRPDSSAAGRAWVVLLALAAMAGCGPPLSAPPLHDDSIYKNAHAGFRFNRPEGWKMVARGEVPSGPVEGERMLVEYKCLTCAKGAGLEVTVTSFPPSTSLADYVKANTLTGEKWRLGGPVEEFTINGVAAVRLQFAMGKSKEEITREIVAFRREDRVYFFKGFYASSDTSARKDIRAAVESIVW
jgi:hypothetical protein